MKGRLRFRMALFFAALAGLSILSVVGGAAVAVHAEGVAPEDLISVVALSGFGIILSAGLVGLLFDENVARPIGALSAALRARAHGHVTVPMDPAAAKHLADLSPAAAAVCERLSDLDRTVDERVAEATVALEAQKEQLAAVFSELPLAVMVLDHEHRIILYDRQCVEALSHIAELALGRCVFDYLDETVLTKSLAKLGAADAAAQAVDLPTADGAATLKTKVRRAGQSDGYVLVMDVDGATTEARPLVFDFGLIDHPVRGPHSDVALRDLPYVVFDTETTGLDPERDELIQIGAVRALNGRIVEGEVFDRLVNPGRRIPDRSSQVHGITDIMVEGKPLPVEGVAAFHRFARSETLVAHNAPFDLAFLSRHTRAAKVVFDAPVLDTVLLSAAIYGEQDIHTLDAIADRLGIMIATSHRHTATGDAVATAQILLTMIPMLEAAGIITLGDAIAAMRRHQRMMPHADVLFRTAP